MFDDNECYYCHYTNFLPIKCQFCKKLFCEKHIQPETHTCVNNKMKTKPKSTPMSSQYQCVFPGC